jgi:hypothetical protein
VHCQTVVYFSNLYAAGDRRDERGYSEWVDIWNMAAGTRSTASLSLGRAFLAATSLPDEKVAIFAGGSSESAQD